MKRFKNIVFDMGGVLLDIDYHRTINAFKELGVANFETFYSQAGAHELFQALEKGTIEPAEFYVKMNEYAGTSYSIADIRDAWNAILIGFRESSLAYLEVLKQKTNVLLLSNTNAIHVDKLREMYNEKERSHPYEEYFHHCIYSFETGTRKPDAACYQWMLDHAKIKAEETLFIDDTEENTLAAERLGISTILLKRGVFIEELGLEEMI